ncbi:SurA N-terminal domain-containing protein [Dankookia sp. P2]|uniref:SurA N-terminal domain-containing protein n=1 Tax=Dankookia sp. P2 TaxID=3423955 RepID=UPI003D672708
MLTALRRLAGTWIAKALFVLLILSFAVWGIGDMAKNLFAPIPPSPASPASR